MFFSPFKRHIDLSLVFPSHSVSLRHLLKRPKLSHSLCICCHFTRFYSSYMFMYMLSPSVLASYFLTFFSSCLLASLFLVIFCWFLSITFPFHELLQEKEGNRMIRFACHSQVLLLVSLCNVVHTFLFAVSFIHYVSVFYSFLSHLLLMSLLVMLFPLLPRLLNQEKGVLIKVFFD